MSTESIQLDALLGGNSNKKRNNDAKTKRKNSSKTTNRTNRTKKKTPTKNKPDTEEAKKRRGRPSKKTEKATDDATTCEDKTPNKNHTPDKDETPDKINTARQSYTPDTTALQKPNVTDTEENTITTQHTLSSDKPNAPDSTAGTTSEKSNMKTYGVNQTTFITRPKMPEEKIILHLPVKKNHYKEEKMFRHEAKIGAPRPMAYDSSSGMLSSSRYSELKCPLLGKKNGCYIMSGAVIKCKQCRKDYNDSLETPDVEKKSAERSIEDDKFKASVPKKKESDVFPHKIRDEPIPEDTPVDLEYDATKIPAKEEATYSPTKVIRPVSMMNHDIDEKPPTRDEFELLKQSYQLLQQKYKVLKQKYDNYNQIVQVTQEDTKGVVTDAPMFTTTVYPLMKSYHSSHEWPDKTNVFCWWDCHPFTTAPVPIPTSYNSADGYFKVQGCFCSMECALAYKNYDRNLDNIDTSLLFFFFNKLSKQPVNAKNLKEAPPRQTLVIFGGHFNIDEFRAFSKDRYLQYDLVNYPLVPIAQYAEVKKKKDPETIKMNQLTQPRLKIKRNKPLMNHKNTLESSMGLNVKKKIKKI